MIITDNESETYSIVNPSVPRPGDFFCLKGVTSSEYLVFSTKKKYKIRYKILEARQKIKRIDFVDCIVNRIYNILVRNENLYFV